jgi:hypothetical protein
MATRGRREGSRLGGMFRMMKSMRKCMATNDSGQGCAGMMERIASSAEGFDCAAMMKAGFGAQGTKPEETAPKA